MRQALTQGDGKKPPEKEAAPAAKKTETKKEEAKKAPAAEKPAEKSAKGKPAEAAAKKPAPVKPSQDEKNTDMAEEDPDIKHEVKSETKVEQTSKEGAEAKTEKVVPKVQGTFEAYVGAELYNKRMFPHGCPSFQKAFVKLYKVEKNKQGTSHLKLIDTQFFTNRDGFGFMLKNLTKGEYQIQFKKYSTGFDVFDFTVRMYA